MVRFERLSSDIRRLLKLSSGLMMDVDRSSRSGMSLSHCQIRWFWARAALACLFFQATIVLPGAMAITISIDYRYDTPFSNFFNTAQKRAPLEAAAARWSAVISTSLTAATLTDDTKDPRIGFTHPSTGVSYQVSAANSSASDAVIPAGGSAANEYRGPWSIAANQWILYPGGRPLLLDSNGSGGTGAGTNITTVFTDNNSHLNRNFRTSSGSTNLPVWGGAISFDNDGSTTWHFDLNTPAPNGSIDIYSVALHEIGHALGLSTGFLDWTSKVSGGQFTGAQAVAAYNSDNGTAISGLNEVGGMPVNHHWQDNTYDSRIFSAAGPNYVGTVGASALQDLLLEPFANYTATVKRFELTNVDVGAIRDIGWTTVPGGLNGDYNNNGKVDGADYVVWRKTIGTPAAYTLWRSNFGNTGSGAGGGMGSSVSAAVPEPASWALVSAVACFAFTRRQRTWPRVV
jgi:hypothetical protein